MEILPYFVELCKGNSANLAKRYKNLKDFWLLAKKYVFLHMARQLMQYKEVQACFVENVVHKITPETVSAGNAGLSWIKRKMVVLRKPLWTNRNQMEMQ